MTEEEKAAYLRGVEEQKAKFEAEERERQKKLEEEAYAQQYAQWKATEYTQWEAECRRLDDEAAAQASAVYEAEWARYNAELKQYNADYAQYQKDLAQWEIAYAQWEKEQSEAQGKPGATTPAPGTGTDPKAPDAPDKDAEEAEPPAAAPELTPEQLAALQRMFGQNAAYKSQIEAQRRAQQQKETVVKTPVPVQFKNLGTEEQAERLDGFLADHPHGSKWDTTDTVAEGNVNGKVKQGSTFVLDPNTVELVWNPAN